MANIIKSISSRIVNSKIVTKFLRLGNDDVQEVPQISPPGFDSRPIKDLVGLYVPTQHNGDAVLVGHILPENLTEPGESRAATA